MNTALLVVFAAQLVRRVHSHPASYTAIFVAAFASWAGLPGPGEAVVIAAAAFAARHRLDIVEVELFAFGGAMVGGMVGWAIGWRFGGALASPRGPLARLRRRGLQTGERFFERFGPLAVLLTPSWVAGIHRLGVIRFAIFNALACAIWAAMYGLTTYFAGPHVVDLFADFGTWSLLALIIVAAGALALWRRRRRAGR